jgi:hypothetical protein
MGMGPIYSQTYPSELTRIGMFPAPSGGGGNEEDQPVVIPNFNYGRYQPTAPVNLKNLFPVLGNQTLQNLYPSQPMTPVANMYGANRFLSPSMMSGLLSFTPSQMTASPAQAPAMTTSNP